MDAPPTPEHQVLGRANLNEISVRHDGGTTVSEPLASTVTGSVNSKPIPGVDGASDWAGGKVVRVPISEIKLADHPRVNGANEDHIRTLASVTERLPPIVVHHDTMHLVDGMHRLGAARLNGADHVEVRFFHGSATDALLLSVRSNVTHGLPLTLTDRKAAATRIITARPDLSDRAIAYIAGLSAATIGRIRRTSDVASDRRIGRDGRVRPVSAAEGRRVASQLLTERPESSLREIAKVAGISLGTARDVRVQVLSNSDASTSSGTSTSIDARRTEGRVAGDNRVDSVTLIASLWRDPSIRGSAQRREILRWLSVRLITADQYQQVIDSIPAHGAILMARIARECAIVWTEFAEALDRKAESS
jgi:ParB-like chromosome segregation protein Spo0J